MFRRLELFSFLTQPNFATTQFWVFLPQPNFEILPQPNFEILPQPNQPNFEYLSTPLQIKLRQKYPSPKTFFKCKQKNPDVPMQFNFILHPIFNNTIWPPTLPLTTKNHKTCFYISNLQNPIQAIKEEI